MGLGSKFKKAVKKVVKKAVNPAKTLFGSKIGAALNLVAGITQIVDIAESVADGNIKGALHSVAAPLKSYGKAAIDLGAGGATKRFAESRQTWAGSRNGVIQTVQGALGGAATGAVMGGVPGAIVGGVTGATLGTVKAASEEAVAQHETAKAQRVQKEEDKKAAQAHAQAQLNASLENAQVEDQSDDEYEEETRRRRNAASRYGFQQFSHTNWR